MSENMNPTTPKASHSEQARLRFFTAAEGEPPTDDQRALVTELAADIRALGAKIIERVPEGRNKSLALTALEDVQMRANRAIFDPLRSTWEPVRQAIVEDVPVREVAGADEDAEPDDIPVLTDPNGAPPTTPPPGPAKCSMCGRERTPEDHDYNPVTQVLMLRSEPMGWYSGDDGEMCPEDMVKMMTQANS